MTCRSRRNAAGMSQGIGRVRSRHLKGVASHGRGSSRGSRRSAGVTKFVNFSI